ncbi:MAG: hypothetical protein NVSMB1_06900 [Polyangiales bacterium]
MVAALLGAVLFPPLYVRALDGLLEPKLAVGAPHEQKLGLRVDLPQAVRPSDVVSSISGAKAGGARLALKDVPVPRIDGFRSVLFPGLTDPESLVRKLATPLAGIARSEPRRLASLGPFDFALDDRDSTHVLRLSRRALSILPGVPLPQPGRVQRFELEGPVDLSASLRTFERGDTEISWIADGLFEARQGSRAIDLGALAYLGIRAGTEANELALPGALLALVDSIAKDRMGHLGLLRRGHCDVPIGAQPAPRPLVPRGTRIMVRASAPIATAAADILAREIEGVSQPVDAATFDRNLRDGRFALAIDAVRAIDESEAGAVIALATFDASPTLPAQGASARAIASGGSAVLAWEISLIGAEAPLLWIPRAPLGGLDLDVASEA